MILLDWHWIINRNMTLLLTKSVKNLLSFAKAIQVRVRSYIRNQIITLERQCWNNAQYSRQETLEISGIPENTDDGELEGKVLTILSKLDVNIDPANIEACH